MIYITVKQKLIEQLGKTPTHSQAQASELLAQFVTSNNSDSIFVMKGYAGTGKTTLLGALVKTLAQIRLKTVLLAPTGRAAKVFGGFAKKTAFTIHKKIYRQKSATEGHGVFALDKNLHKNTVFIVDEASMISDKAGETSAFGTGRLLEDLLEFVYSEPSCKLILSGDTAQLPPVGTPLSPALDAQVLQQSGYDIVEAQLTDVVRQNLDSGILYNATELRNLLPEYFADMGFPQLFTKNYTDVQKVPGDELIQLISDSYDKHGIEDTLIVCRSNKRANQFNQGIRQSVLYREEQIAVGDYIMVVKNNYHWVEDYDELDFIANGDIAEIVRIGKYKSLYGFNFADATLRFPDYNDVEIETTVLLDTLTSESASLSYDENNKLYQAVSEDYADLGNKRTIYKRVRENPYFNALQIKFAYSVTCHKAQGGQWKNVFVDQGYITEEMLNREFLRWLYTAVTRATENLYLVNFKKEFFEEESSD